MAIVLFDQDFEVTEGLRITREVVEELFAEWAYVNGRIITVTAKLRADLRVEQVDLSAAAATLRTRPLTPPARATAPRAGAA